jgi:spore germination protein GerM
MVTRAIAVGIGAGLAVAAPWAVTGVDRAAARPTLRTTVYFLVDEGRAPIGVRRTIEGRPPYARAALTALLAGPTHAEREAGTTTAVPDGTRLRSLTFVGPSGAEAVVDLSGLSATAGGVDRVRVISQVTRTLVGLSGIERVRLRNDGRPWGLWSMSGGMLDEAYDLNRLVGFFHVCAAVPGTEAIPGDCFSAVP